MRNLFFYSKNIFFSPIFPERKVAGSENVETKSQVVFANILRSLNSGRISKEDLWNMVKLDIPQLKSLSKALQSRTIKEKFRTPAKYEKLMAATSLVAFTLLGPAILDDMKKGKIPKLDAIKMLNFDSFQLTQIRKIVVHGSRNPAFRESFRKSQAFRDKFFKLLDLIDSLTNSSDQRRMI